MTASKKVSKKKWARWCVELIREGKMTIDRVPEPVQDLVKRQLAADSRQAGVVLEGTVRRETAKAVLLKITAGSDRLEGQEVWLPFSRIRCLAEADLPSGVVRKYEVPMWLAEKKGA